MGISFGGGPQKHQETRTLYKLGIKVVFQGSLKGNVKLRAKGKDVISGKSLWRV
jgi:hypothetical protein